MKSFTLILMLLCFSVNLQAQWIGWEEQTDGRIIVNNVFDNDNANLVDDQEKDLAIGDFNKDSFMDLVVVRKFPFSIPGRKVDLLFMNRNGVLTDETEVFAPGFLENPTDARDVISTDVNNDDWLDILVISTFNDQPRLYVNRGEDANGDWLGFADESEARLPNLEVLPFQYCAAAAADITGDGSVDIYMTNYASGEVAPDILLINDGNGNFTEETDARMGNLRNSSFGTAIEFHDVDNDGDLDIVKNLGLAPIPPFNDQGVFALFNNGDGTFTNWFRFPTNLSYMMTGADFNEDGMMDFYIVDDSADYTHSITGFEVDQSLTIEQTFIPTDRTNQFGGNVKVADLDNDGDLDVAMSSVDVDIPPCNTGQDRRFIIFENEGDASGDIVHSYGATINEWNVSSYDHDYIDLDSDGDLDIILATCEGYSVFMNDTEVLGVDDAEGAAFASIFPNPAKGFVNISLDNLQTNSLQVQLYTVTGSLLLDENYDFTLSRTTQIDISVLQNTGVYLMKLTAPDGSSISKKIIVE